MKNNMNRIPGVSLIAGVSAFAILFAGGAIPAHKVLGFASGVALADSHGGGGSGNGEGGNGQGGDGHGGGSESGGSDAGQGGKGDAQKGRPSSAGEDDSEGQGPRAGQGGQGDSGGKPGWAQEGIPEVELGRLSVARSPDKVLARALDEVVDNWDTSMSSLYNMSAEAFASYVADHWDSITIVDSPLQNLAMMEALYDGTLDLSKMQIDPVSTTDLASIFLGVASDKAVPISADTVTALNVIMDLGLDSTEIQDIATKAEEVREGVLEGHG